MKISHQDELGIEYEIDSAGLDNSKLLFRVAASGNIKYGIGLRISSFNWGFVISLADAWKMVVVATVGFVKQTMVCWWINITDRLED